MHPRLIAGALAMTATAIAGVGPWAAPAAAADHPCVDLDDATMPRENTSRPSHALDLLGIVAAQGAASPPTGRPVRVAVLGSGVRAPSDGAITVAAEHTEVGGSPTVDPSATVVAGLVAAAPRDGDPGDPIGVAPDAEVVDVRVYVDGRPDTDSVAPNPGALAAGLDWVAEQASELNIKVATVGFTTDAGSELRKAVQKVQHAGVIVVAASGDRDPDDEDATSTDPLDRDEDAAGASFPAAYPGVVAVNSTSDGDPGADALAHVLNNSLTSVAAPTFDAVSYGLNGATCLVEPISTGAAAAQVSGVLALLWQTYPKDTDDQIVARLLNTATGTLDTPTPLAGAGVVQPYAALTRPLAPSAHGHVEHTVTQVDQDVQATAPEREADLLASTREDAVWWGLIGGGVLVVALLLRPVLARRRP